MRSQRVSCVVDGDTYLGTYAIIAVREHQAVVVSYKQARRSTKVGDRASGLVARELLGALVRDDLAVGPSSAGPLHRRSADATIGAVAQPRDAIVLPS